MDMVLSLLLLAMLEDLVLLLAVSILNPLCKTIINTFIVDESTPRTGTGRTPFQQDTTIFNGNTGCGRTLAGGANNIQAGTQAVVSKYGGLPQVTPGGSLQMTLHQINADGAGPYRCTIDMTGTGNNFQTVQVTQNVGGFAGFSFGNGATPQPLTVQMPANMQCTGQIGGMSGVCMVR